jgi:hypothetical protein
LLKVDKVFDLDSHRYMGLPTDGDYLAGADKSTPASVAIEPSWTKIKHVQHALEVRVSVTA